MIEAFGNIFGQNSLKVSPDWVCITTNQCVKSNGLAVMGRGVALQACKFFPGIDKELGRKLQEGNLGVYPLLKVGGQTAIAFPTKYHWRDPSPIELIAKSCRELRELWISGGSPDIVIALPRPGCENGGLTWQEVRPTLESELPERNFVIIALPNSKACVQ